jgi:hypothetical protein
VWLTAETRDVRHLARVFTALAMIAQLVIQLAH